MALEAVGSNPIIHPIFIFNTIIGVSSSGKTTDFDSVIRRFESCHPCQEKDLVERQGLFQLNPPLRVGEILLPNMKYAYGV